MALFVYYLGRNDLFFSQFPHDNLDIFCIVEDTSEDLVIDDDDAAAAGGDPEPSESESPTTMSPRPDDEEDEDEEEEEEEVDEDEEEDRESKNKRRRNSSPRSDNKMTIDEGKRLNLEKFLALSHI